jgi:hypothetical protein
MTLRINKNLLLQGGKKMSCLSVACSRNCFSAMKDLVMIGGKQLLDISEGVRECAYFVFGAQMLL